MPQNMEKFCSIWVYPFGSSFSFELSGPVLTTLQRPAADQYSGLNAFLIRSS